MKIFFTFLCTLLVNAAVAQFAIIYDKEGTCNVRSVADSNAIVDTLNNGHLVYVFETKGNWTEVDYRKNGEELRGLIYKDRLVPVSSFQDIPILTKENFKTVLGKDSVKVILTGQKFIKGQHKLTYNKEYKEQLELIDNKMFWGTDGGLPYSEYKSIEVYIGKTKITLPKHALEGLYEISLHTTEVNYDKANNVIYIQARNSDGAGSYDVLWKIEKGVYKDRLIVYGF